MQEIVFPVLPDLESRKGDQSYHKVQSAVKFDKLARPIPTATSATCESSSQDSKGDSCDNYEHEQREQGELEENDSCDTHPKISYSVSYFNWSVSDQSSEEDECENITVRLDRMKIRKSSRERREILKEKEISLL